MLHPEAEELLLFVDGELPRASRAAIRNHLEGCWKCRTELEQLESVISGFMRYKSKLEEAGEPVSRTSGAELRRKLEALDRELAGPGLLVRVRRLLGLPEFSAAGRLASGVLALAGAGLALALASHFMPQLWNRQEAPPPTHAPAVKPAVPVPPPAVALVPKPRPEPDRPPARSAEVAAWVGLHDLGADLGEPVDVVPAANGAATVVCRQVGPQREMEIRTALAGIAGLTVRSEPAPQEGASRKPRAAVASGAVANAAEPALVAALGGRSAFDRLANEILEADDAVLSRAHAIRAIEERFTPTRQAALDAADRAALDRIVADHRRAARESAQQLDHLLGAVPSALGASGAAGGRAAESSLFPAAQRMDRIVGVVFGGSPSTLSAQDLGTELNSARAQLAAALEAGR